MTLYTYNDGILHKGTPGEGATVLVADLIARRCYSLMRCNEDAKESDLAHTNQQADRLLALLEGE